MIIRKIQSSDNRILAEIIRAVFIEHDAPQQGTVYSDPTTDDLFQYFQTKKATLFVAELNDKIVGCCGIYPTEGLATSCTELVKFYIQHSARGKGVGKALMEHSVSEALNLGYTEMYIESLPDFTKAVRIYEKQGFQRLKQPLGNSGHTTCNIWMLKQLK
jgi:putative acetyltransferase